MSPAATLLLAPALAFLGCTSPGVVLGGGGTGGGGGEVAGGASGGGESGGGESGAEDDTGQGGGSGSEDDTGQGGGAFDCSSLSDEPGEAVEVEGAKGYHGLAFDSEGRIYGTDGSSIIRATSDGEWEVWLPGLGYIEQLAFLPDGDLLVAHTYSGDIVRISPEGGQERVASAVHSYAVLVGPDERVYLTTGKFVARLDLGTGELEYLGATESSWPPHSLAFSKDHSKLYVGTAATVGGQSTVYALALDAELEPVGELEPFAVGVGQGWHDGIAVDACENVYVTEFGSRTLYRITPDGEHVAPYRRWSGTGQRYAHGLAWGPEVGGWNPEALYVPMPYLNFEVMAHTVGVRGAHWDGEVELAD